MKNYTYLYKGEQFTLTPEELSPFNNEEPFHRIDLNSPAIFHLKEGGEIEGIPIHIEYLRPIGGSEPALQAEITVKVKNSDEPVILNFTQIESHEPTPFEGNPLFKKS